MYKENNWFVLENYLSQHYVFGGPIYAPDILGDHFHEETIDWVERTMLVGHIALTLPAWYLRF